MKAVLIDLSKLDKYLFLIVIIYCFGILEPDFGSKYFLMDLDLNERLTGKAGSDYFKQFFWLLMFLIIIIRVFLSRDIQKYIWDNKKVYIFFGSLCLLSLLTVLWSKYPIYTLKRVAFQFIFLSVVISSLLFCLKETYTQESIRILSAILVSYVFVSIILTTGFTGKYELAGYMKGKNLLGMALAVVLLIYIIIFDGSEFKKLDYILIGALVVFLIMTVSKTNIALIMICMVLLKVKNFLVKPFVFVFVLALTLIFVTMPGIYHLYGDNLDVSYFVTDEFITGRGIIWSNLYYELYYFDNIFLGHGYGAFFGVGEVPLFFDDKYSFLRYISSAHNGYLELLIQFGLILASFVFLFSLLPVFKVKDIGLLAVFCFVYVHNITESSFMRDQSLIWLLYIIAVVLTYYKHDMRNAKYV